MVLRYTANEKDSGRKVYSIMRRELQISATLTRRLKRSDAIRLDGCTVFTDHVVAAGETVELDITAAEPPCDIQPEEGPIQILYEDAGLIAVDKPAGLIIHPTHARYCGTLANRIAGYLQQTCGDGRCHAVNRLDRDTTGVVLFAKNSHMKALAAAALGAPDSVKEYCAIVIGEMPQPDGTIDRPIRRLRERDMMRIISPDGQTAVTRYETLGALSLDDDVVSLLKLTLETGRTHQIRVHCLALGHPVLGDILYHTDASRALSQKLNISTQALHAQRLDFTHPISCKKLCIEAPLPDVFRQTMNSKGL